MSQREYYLSFADRMTVSLRAYREAVFLLIDAEITRQVVYDVEEALCVDAHPEYAGQAVCLGGSAGAYTFAERT